MEVESIFSRGKCRKFPANWCTFPRKTNKNSGKANIPQGKCPGFVRDWCTFPVNQKNGATYSEDLFSTIILFMLYVIVTSLAASSIVKSSMPWFKGMNGGITASV